jgi:hypothetical protein
MPILSQPAFGPKLAITFITGGALIDVWALVWRYTVAPEVLSPSQRFWYLGLLLTGLTFVVIGAFLGSIGRAARKAELPPREATPAEESIQHAAAATPHPVAPGVAMNPALAAPLAGNVPNPAAATAAQPMSAPPAAAPQVRPAM